MAPVLSVTSASRASAERDEEQHAEHRIRQQVLRLVPEAPGRQLVAGHRRGEEDEPHVERSAGPTAAARVKRGDARLEAGHSGSGYISQPSTTAVARIRRTSSPPDVSAGAGRRASARQIRSTRETRRARAAGSGWSLPPHRDVERIEDDEKIQQPGDDEKAVAVLVGRGRHLAARRPRACARASTARRARCQPPRPVRRADRKARTEIPGRAAPARSRTSG